LFKCLTTYVGVGTTEEVAVFVTVEIASVGTFVGACCMYKVGNGLVRQGILKEPHPHPYPQPHPLVE
jgi:hypothetical protein